MPADTDSALPIRGTIEGFYGPPWSHQQRLAHLAFSVEVGLNTYVYAPKDDPLHRERWRDPYPPAGLEQIAELAGTAHALGLRFVYALHPALSMRFADDKEHAALADKAAHLFSAGVRSFALLFDDVPAELTDADDVAAFGAGPAGTGAAHGRTCRRFAAEFLARHGLHEPLLVCPTDYAGIAPSPYRESFAQAAPDNVEVAWTGAGIVVGAVTRSDIDRAAATYRRRLVLWDNFPVNDFDPSRLFLGPLTGRAGDLRGAALAGVLANPMIQAVPSRIALATVADWARDPAGYDPAASAHRALLRVAGGTGLEPFVRVCSTWPPSDDQDPELTTATGAALTGDSAALDVVSRRLTELARCCRAAREPADLVDGLRPWLNAAADTAQAGLIAVDLVRAVLHAPPTDARVGALRQQARAALDRAQSHHAAVLRPIVPPFVRAALERTAPAGPARGDKPVRPAHPPGATPGTSADG